MLALAELHHRDRLGAGDTARAHDGFVVADETGHGLDSRIRIGFQIRHLKFDLLAEHALLALQ